MKSKKALFQVLDEYFNTDRFVVMGLKARGISNETYGRKSCIYINCGFTDTRRNLENFLTVRGFKVNRDYNTERATVEVIVSYFRGDQWYV